MSAFFNPATTEAQKFEADLVVVNARVHTMDAARPTAEAVAVYGNRVTRVFGPASARTSAFVPTAVMRLP